MYASLYMYVSTAYVRMINKKKKDQIPEEVH